MLHTDLGHARVYVGSIVIERQGSVWVRSADEVFDFIENLKSEKESAITNVGPGKAHIFGTILPKRGRSKRPSTGPSTRQLRFHKSAGTLPTIEWIHLGKLSVDKTYQRSTDNEASRRLIVSIAVKFDWRLCGPLIVSRRADDTLTIIDGQHRWMGACKRTDIPQLPCCVFRYESIEEEARMFILANRARKSMNRLDDFYAALAAADEDALEIQQLVTDAGLRIARNTSSTSWQAGEVAFTATIAHSVRKFGIAITSSVLTNMAVAFPNQKLIHGGAIFGGLIQIMSQQVPGFDPDRLVSTLQTRTVDEWGACVAGLKGGKLRAQALRGAIMEAYEAHCSVDTD